MIVQRNTFVAKVGKREELAAIMLAEQASVNLPITFRVYTAIFAPTDTVVAEWEFENLVEYEKFWADWWARPETESYMKKWLNLLENSGCSELWNLEE